MTNLDYETALLGAVLRGYPDLAGLARTVGPDDFALLRHADIWQAALAVDRAGDVGPAHRPRPDGQRGRQAARRPGVPH